jgi:mannose-6-phosphate isomerase-like protein (cupin superfamily)
MSAEHNETGRASRARTPVVSVDAVPKAARVAHEGVGQIHVRRLFDAEDFETSMMFVEHVEMPPGTSIGIHKHGDDEEFYFILSGSGRMVVDGQEYRVKSGDLVLNRRGGSHGLLNDSDHLIDLLVWQVAFDTAGHVDREHLTGATAASGDR